MDGLRGGSAVLLVEGAEGMSCQPDERRAGSIDDGDELQDLWVADLGQQLRLLHPALAPHPASGGQQRLDQPLVTVTGCVEEGRQTQLILRVGDRLQPQEQNG